MYKIWCRFQKTEKKIEKNFLILEKIVFELISLNTHFDRERILVTWSQYVNEQFQDFWYP